MRKHEGIVRYASLITIGITSGLFITLPFMSLPFSSCTKTSHIESRALHQNIEEVCHTDAKENKWQYIVIHHSATGKGSATAFDNYHRNKRGWENGLAYHFVIGNGTYSRDGEIEPSDRWERQIHGAHAGNMEYNRVSIGICLVGDFENNGAPTQNQFESTAKLVQYLSRKYSIPMSKIIMHKQVAHKCTACPGKNFPFEELKTRLLQVASKKDKHTREL